MTNLRDNLGWLITYLLIIFFTFDKVEIFAILSLCFMILFIANKDLDKILDKDVKKIVISEDESISILLEYYSIQDTVRWCMTTYKWTRDYSTQRINHLIKLKQSVCPEMECSQKEKVTMQQ